MSSQRKSAFVSGGSRGIGREIVRELVKQNYNVTFSYLSSEKLAKSLCEELSDRAMAIKCDVADFNSVEQAIHQHSNVFGGLDFLVNNAGIKIDSSFKKMSVESWKNVLDTNLSSVFYHCQSAIKLLLDTGGKIVNVSSVSGMVGVPGQINYSASKAGIVGLTRSLSKEYAARGVTVNAVAPGFIDTDMTNEISNLHKERILESIPMKKFGEVSSLAQIIVFLGSPACSYITGQTIVVDGGLSS